MGNAYQIFSNFLFAKAGNSGIPLSGTFELTSRCNLDCKMCYIHKRANDLAALRGEKTTAQWLSLAEECARAGTLMLLLTGGEPLIRSDFREIYSGCKKLGMMVSINSNASLMDERMMDALAKDPPSRVNITLYGASPATYGALCGDPTAYDRVIRAILGLQERGVSVKLNFSTTQFNRQDAPKVFRFAKEHQLPIQAATYMFPPIRACEQGCVLTQRMTPRETAQAQIVYDRFRFSEEELKSRWQAQLEGVMVPDPDTECQEFPTERIKCRAGHTTFWVTWDGKLRPCGMMTEPNIDLEEGRFFDGWEKLRQAREEIMIPAKCTSCKMGHVCDQCPALCYAETGSFTQAPDYMCQRTEAYLELIRQALEGM